MKQMKRSALLVGAVMTLFAFVAMNVAAQDTMQDKMMDGQMMMMMKKSS